MSSKNPTLRRLLKFGALILAAAVAVVWHSGDASSSPPVLQQLSPMEAAAIAQPRQGRFSAPAPNAVMTAHVGGRVDGKSWRIVSYLSANGKLCAGLTWPGEGQAISCATHNEWFANSGVYVEVGESQAVGEPLTWSQIVVSGMIDLPRVKSIELVSTDCSRRAVPTDAEGFFLDVTSSAQIAEGVWPYKLVAYGPDGYVVQTSPVEPQAPDTDAAEAANVTEPEPDAQCK